jgi:hypothetical protein
MPGDQAHPQPRVQEKSTRVSHHRFAEHSGIPCARVYDLLRALSGDRLFVTVARETISQTSRQRRGAKTTRLRRPLLIRSSVASKASIASRPTFVTMANAPLPGGTREAVGVICPSP